MSDLRYNRWMINRVDELVITRCDPQYKAKQIIMAIEYELSTWPLWKRLWYAFKL